jgi:hypothetical protein
VAPICGEESCKESDILAGMDWAARQGADVVNLSLRRCRRPRYRPVGASRQKVEGGSVSVKPPKGTGTVSLAVTAADAEGTTVEQTVIDAYGFR